MARLIVAGTFEAGPNFRWTKMFRGKRYRVSCAELGLDREQWTKEGSYRAANQWWHDVLQGRKKEVQALAADNMAVMMDIAETLNKGIAEHQEKEGRPILDLKRHGEKYLARKKAKIKGNSYKEVAALITSLYTIPFLANIDSKAVSLMYDRLAESGLSGGEKKKRWGFFRSFILHLWENDLCEMPKNLKSRELSFKADDDKEIIVPSVADVRALLAELPPRLKCYCMLALNCAFTNIDVANLKKSQLDMVRGRLVRKRGKTKRFDRVPTVDYKLWPETLELLRQCWSEDPVWALTSLSGTQLYTIGADGEKKDLVGQQWRRPGRDGEGQTIPFKMFRKVGATILESHAHYGRYKIHYLGHAANTVADKNYAKPSVELFDTILDWLREAVMG